MPLGTQEIFVLFLALVGLGLGCGFLLWLLIKLIRHNKTKTCSNCAEQIKAAAQVCRFCQCPVA